MPAPPLAPLLRQAIDQHLRDRTAARHAFANADFEAIDRLYVDIEQRAMAGAGFNDPARQETVDFYFLVDTPKMQPPARQLALLQRWCAARPGSYWAAYFLGAYWEAVARHLRGTEVADKVSTLDFAAAVLARDNACIHLLRACGLHPKPLDALYLLMRVNAFLGQAPWLEALRAGQPVPTTGAHYFDDEPELQRMAVERLLDYGGGPEPLLTAWPAQAPRWATDHTDYRVWLDGALSLAPDFLEVLRLAVHYLRPRWHGAPGEAMAFIHGPTSKALSDAERNALVWLEALDELECLPPAHDPDAVNAQAQRYAHLLTLPLPPLNRCELLFFHAKFLSFNDQVDASYAALAQACALQGQHGVVFTPEPHLIRFLTHDLVQSHHPDPEQVLANILLAAEPLTDHVWHLLLAAAGRHSGLWGLPRGDAALDLERVLAVVRASPEQHEHVLEVLKALWNGHHGESALWLAEMLAQHGVALAQSFLAFVHFGYYSGGPPVSVDPERARAWQQSAVTAAIPHPLAEYHYTRNCLIPDDIGAIADAEALAEVRANLLKAIEHGIGEARERLFRVLAYNAEPAEALWLHDELALVMLQAAPSDYEHVVAATFLAWFYKTGRGGVPQSPTLALAWARYARAIDHNDNFTDTLDDMVQQLTAEAPKPGFFKRMLQRAASGPNDDWVTLVQQGRAYRPPDGFLPE